MRRLRRADGAHGRAPKVCRKANCRNALRASRELFDQPFSLFGAEALPDAGRSPKKLDFMGVGLRAKCGRAAPEGASELDRRPWRLVAGPELSPRRSIVLVGVLKRKAWTKNRKKEHLK